MSDHRRAPARVPNKAQHDNFNPADALESVYADLIQVDAFAHAASEAIVQLRAPSNRAERRTFARIYTLVTKAADEARAALLHGDELVSALSTHREARRARSDADAPAPRT
jgi:hypothetical protein